MSYILDALKRAQAERERGAVPGLHTRPLIAPNDHTGPGRQSRLWLLIASVLAVGSVAAGLWVWQSPTFGPQLAAVAPGAASPEKPVGPVVSVPPVPLAASAVTPGPLAVPTESVPAPVAVPVPVPEPPPVRSAPPSRVQAVPAPKVAAPTPTPAPSTAKASVAKAALPAVPLLGELPEDIRRQIAPLVITGAVYSENPGQRLLLINNQVLVQGSVIAPDLKLEEIQPRGAVFDFKGTRFRVVR